MILRISFLMYAFALILGTKLFWLKDWMTISYWMSIFTLESHRFHAWEPLRSCIFSMENNEAEPQVKVITPYHFRHSLNLHSLRRFASAWRGIGESGSFFVGQVIGQRCPVALFLPEKPICKRSLFASHISYLRFEIFSDCTSKTSAVLLRRRFWCVFSWYPCNAIQEKAENDGIWGGKMPS